MNTTSAPLVPQPPASWLESAYTAIDAGYAVFLLHGKIPLKGFQWREHATRDKAELNRWSLQRPDVSSYGIALSADDLILDIDPRNFPQGRDVGAELITRFPAIRFTRAIKTAGGGYHFYLKKDPQQKVRKSQCNWQGVDFLSEGNYVVGLGSSTASGVYSMLTTASQAQAAPADLLAILEPPSEATLVGAGESLLMQEKFVAECQTAAPAIQGQFGDNTTFLQALRGRDLGLPLESVFRAMRDHYNPRCQPTWNDADLYKKVCSAYKSARGAAGQSSPEAAFMNFAPTEPPAQVEQSENASDVNAAAKEADEKPKQAKGNAQSKALLACAEGVTLLRDAAGIAYATVLVNGNFEHYRISSEEFEKWLSYSYFKKTGSVASANSLKDAIRTLTGRASFEGMKCKADLRVAECEGRIFVDLRNEQRQQIRIGKDGYGVIESGASPAVFVSFAHMLPLSLPTAGSPQSFLKLKELLGLDRDSFVLLLGFILGCFRPEIATPLLMISGEPGSGKSFLTRAISLLLDPSINGLKSPPEDVRDLFVASVNNYFLPFDNMATSSTSSPKAWGNAICVHITGGTYTKRENYSDDREKCLRAQHQKIVFNGVSESSLQPDVLDRSILINPPLIAEHKRRTEASLTAEFEAMRSELLGAICTAISGALRRLPGTYLEKLPRMADFALWVTAAEPDLGLEPGEFMNCYLANQRKGDELILESSPLGQWILNDLSLPFEGSASELLTQMIWKLGRDRMLPHNARGLSTRLKYMAQQLRRLGVNVSWLQRTREKRLIRIERVASKDPFDELK